VCCLFVCLFVAFSSNSFVSINQPAVAVAFSPGNDLLATAHLDDVGVFLWSNRAHFAQVFLRPFDPSAMLEMKLPSHNPEDNDFFVYKVCLLFVVCVLLC